MQPGFEARTHRESSQAVDLKDGVEGFCALSYQPEMAQQGRNHKGVERVGEAKEVTRQGFRSLQSGWPLIMQVPTSTSVA